MSDGGLPVTWVGVATFDVHTPDARSKKDKRGVVTPLVERLRRRYPVSVARLAGVDRLDRETIGLVVINADAAQCRSVLETATAYAATFGARVDAVRIDVERWD
ncbi:MAG: DUF503 domain-containing protein [Trueperaceae bacterium]|nr:DUF503 domain-containing protein [Trueperaceae bacterium]